MKVVHLTQRYPPAVGGAETWCREVCQHLAQTDEMKVLTLDVLEEEEFWRDPPVERCTTRLGRLDWDGRVLVRRYARSLPIHTFYHSVLRFVVDRGMRIYFYGPHSVEMYGRLLAEVGSADVVHLHTVPYPHNFFGYLAGRLRRKRVVITPHFHPGHPHYERWSNYWLMKRCDAVIAVSEYERDYLAGKGVDRERIVVTGNGVHVEDYQPPDQARFTADLFRAHRLPAATRIVTFLGRKLEYKGIATLVEAFRRLPPDRRAALVLAGPSTPWFDEFYAGLPLADRARVIDLGAISHADKVNLLHLADVLVLPSQFEAFGIVLLEAWACGTPVIAAATGAMPGIVGDGGLVFEHGDAAELAGKIEELLADPVRARRMAKHGRDRLLERYTWDKIGEATRTAYGTRRAKGRRLRVLISSNLFPPHTSGGAEIVAQREGLILEEMGAEVRVFCGGADPAAGRSYPAVSEHGALETVRIGLAPADLSGEWWNFRNEAVRRRFAAMLDRFAPDVVHFHNLVGLSTTMIDECEARAIPTVMTLHDYWGICFKNTLLKNDGALCGKGGFDCLDCKATLAGESSAPSPVRNSHVLLALRKVDRFVSPSRYLADRYVANGIPAERITVIKNGIDLERFAGTPKEGGPFTLGFIGYLGKHKGLDVLLRALTLIPAPETIRLLVSGDGEERENLQTLAHELGLDGTARFLGRIDNAEIGKIYAQIDVLVVPSVWPENSPVTITEAMASGIPVIASDVGGTAELVDDGVTGCLARPRDAGALADRIERLRNDPHLREEMGREARARIGAQGARDQVTRLRDLFEELIAKPRTRPPREFDVVLYSSPLYWHRALRDMLRQLAVVEEARRRRLLVCRLDLCDDDTLRAAKVLVLPTAGGDARLDALRALDRRIPLVVTEEDPELVELCRQSKAGLVYALPEELRASVELLLTDESLRREMGASGQRFARNPSVPGADLE